MNAPVVLLVSPTGATGGAERALTGLARHLHEFGYEPRAVVLGPGPLRRWLVEVGCSVEVLPYVRMRDAIGVGRILRALRTHVRDATVVVGNHAKAHALASAAGSAANVPVVWWQHGWPDGGAIDRIARAVGRGPIVCATQAIADEQRRAARGRRVEVVPYGIRSPEVAAWEGMGGQVRAQQSWEARRVVGIVGRLQPWKGQEIFLRAAARAIERHDDLSFAVVGGAILGWEGDYPERLRSLADKLGITERVVFTGHQDPVYPWIDALDIFVHASFREPFGLAVLEAMVLAKPVVVSDDAGVAECLEDEVSALFVSPGDDEKLAGAICRLLDHPDFASRIGQAGQVEALSFTETAMAACFAQLFDDLVG